LLQNLGFRGRMFKPLGWFDSHRSFGRETVQRNTENLQTVL